MAARDEARTCGAERLGAGIFYDEQAQEYLIFWASTIPGRFPQTEESGDAREDQQKLNHRIYLVTTKDFVTYSPTSLFYDGGFNVIDATIVRAGAEFVMIVKDETKRPVARKHLRVTRAPRARGPYGPASPPISADWVEGPTILKVGEHWILYYDEYTRHRYGAIRSNNLRDWTVISDQVRFPAGMRHGTAFAASEAIIRAACGAHECPQRLRIRARMAASRSAVVNPKLVSPSSTVPLAPSDCRNAGRFGPSRRITTPAATALSA